MIYCVLCCVNMCFIPFFFFFSFCCCCLILCLNLGATPIMLAVQNRHSRTVQKLVQHQANIEMYDRAKQTPIVIAINNSDRATVQSLCKVCTC